MEISALEILSNLGVAAVVVGMAFFLFWKLVKYVLDREKEKHDDLIKESRLSREAHTQERQQWYDMQSSQSENMKQALEYHAQETTRSIKEIIKGIESS